jgi:surface antigen
MDSMDKFKMQQNVEQFKNRAQTNSQNTTILSQETVQEKKAEAAMYEEREEKITDTFNKMAEKHQKPHVGTMINIYGIPLLILAVIGVLFLFVWHQNL